MISRPVSFIGAATYCGGPLLGPEKGPAVIRNSNICRMVRRAGIWSFWKETILCERIPALATAKGTQHALQFVVPFSRRLAETAYQTVENNHFPVIIGGDHSCAIGTWSGIISAYQAEQNFGLIWIDAHMDAHTPQTSHTLAIHGMPVATLLGYGYPSLVNISSNKVKIDPQHLCLIGIRSYESGEAALLRKLGVKVIMMEELKKRGFKSAFEEAIEIASSTTLGFGISIDLDGFDPQFASGVSTPVKGGINPSEALPILRKVSKLDKLKGIEIAEFNPDFDQNHTTKNLCLDLLESIIGIDGSDKSALLRNLGAGSRCYH